MCFINKLGNIGSDKYLHLVCSLLLVFIIGQALNLLTPVSLPVCAVFGALITFALGIFKEIYDRSHGGKYDKGDLYADLIGCILGAIVTAF